MNYEKIYADFIADRRTKEASLIASGEYSERHHITPKSLGGSDSIENLIFLSVTDHISAHAMLAKIHQGRMWSALHIIGKGYVGSRRKRMPYTKKQRAKIAFARKISAKNQVRGESHPNFGKKMSEESRKKMSEIGVARSKMGLNFMTQNPKYFAGDNHWSRKDIAAKEKHVPLFKANLQKAISALKTEKNPMKRTEVKEKISEIQKQHWKNGTGVASAESNARRRTSLNTEEYLSLAKERVKGEKNPMFGMIGNKNPNSRCVVCIETGVVFESVKEASKFCGGDVTKAARTGGLAGGYHWKRIGSHAADGRIMKKPSNKSSIQH